MVDNEFAPNPIGNEISFQANEDTRKLEDVKIGMLLQQLNTSKNMHATDKNNPPPPFALPSDLQGI